MGVSSLSFDGCIDRGQGERAGVRVNELLETSLL
jgi:hypothetical protein